MGRAREFCILVFLICILSSSFSQSSSDAATWNPEVRLTSIPGQSWGPQIAAYNGILHLVWFEYPGNTTPPLWSVPEIYYSRSMDNGNTWSTAVNISNNPGRIDSFPVVAADAYGVYVLWSSDSMTGEVYFRRSTDGGGTWQAEQQLSHSGPDRYSRATDILVDNHGAIHVLWYDSRDINAGQIYHRQSCDHGATWTPEENVTRFDGVVDNEHPKIAQGTDDNLYVIFRSSRNGDPHGGMPPFDMYVLRSKSLGCPSNAAWVYPAQRVSRGLPEQFANSYSGSLRAGRNGILHTAYWNEKRGNNVIYRRGIPAGAGWGPEIDLSRFGLSHAEAQSGDVEATSPGLAEDGANGVHAVFSEHATVRDGVTVGRLFLASSTDGGLTWEAPAQLGASLVTSSPKTLFSNNRLHVVWADWRDNNYGSEIYYRNLDYQSVGNTSPSLVDHYYASILKRTPDLGGKAYWENEVTRTIALGIDLKESYMVMAGNFFNSTEYAGFNRTDRDFVADLYLTFFNRAPDEGGLNYWIGQLTAFSAAFPGQRDIGRNMVMFSFLFSQEFNSFMTALYGTTASRAEIYVVVDFYRGALNRLPDDGGFSYWINRVRTAQCTGAAAVTAEVNEISRLFFSSQEYLTRSRTNEQYVQDLYYAFMRRFVLSSEVSYWKGVLDSKAKTRDQVRRDFLYSPEFQSRVTAVINQGCLR